MTATVRRAYPYLLLAPAILPLVIGWGLMYPFLVPKTLLFYTLGLLTLAAFVFLTVAGERFYFSRLATWWACIPAALLVLAYIASLTGLDFYRSFWSIYNRGDGLLMETFAVAYFYMILVSADNAWFKKFTATVASVAGLTALYGVIEWLVTGGRIESTIGNPAFLAGYLGVALFVTLYAAEGVGKTWRRIFYTGATLQLLAIIFTATRGTMLALVVAAAVLLIYLAVKGGGSVRKIALWLIVAGFVLATFFFVFRTQLRTVSFSPVQRIAQISLADPDISSRLFIWRNMLTEIEKRPILGYGAEHIDTPFNSFYDPSVVGEEWFDRSHNAYLDYAVQYGLLGPVLYLGIIALLIVSAWRIARKEPAGLWLVLAGLAYGVQNFFVFDTITSWWLLLALTAVLLALTREGEAKPLMESSTAGQWTGRVIAAVLLALIVPCSVLPLIANADLAQAYLYHAVDVGKTNAYLENGRALGTYADLEYGYQAYSMYIGEQATVLTGPARVAAYSEDINILKANYDRYPFDARTALYYAHALSEAPPETPADPNLIQAVAQRAIALSPKRYQSWFVRANLLLDAANKNPIGSAARASGYADAIALLNQYATLVPRLSEPHYVLAQLYLAQGDSTKSAQEAALGKTYFKGDRTTALRAAGFYESVKDWPNARFMLQAVLQQTPTDYASQYDLAKVEYLGGDPASAETIVASLRTLDPSILSTDQNFLAAITAYEQSVK